MKQNYVFAISEPFTIKLDPYVSNVTKIVPPVKIILTAKLVLKLLNLIKPPKNVIVFQDFIMIQTYFNVLNAIKIVQLA
jgi:hypothetical protein